jgi:hypothetical protein
VSGEFLTGGEGHKEIIPLRISRGREGNGTQGTCAESVGGIFVLKKLDILPELKPHTIVVGDAGAGDNSSGAHRVGDSVFSRENIETAHNIRYHVCDRQTREPFENANHGRRNAAAL